MSECNKVLHFFRHREHREHRGHRGIELSVYSFNSVNSVVQFSFITFLLGMRNAAEAGGGPLCAKPVPCGKIRACPDKQRIDMMP